MGEVDSLEQVSSEIAACRTCPLHLHRTHVVPGEGAAPASLMLIGEGPGRQEDEEGRPFVGAAGKLLDRMLAAIHRDRSNVYIANVVKCRPPENRAPTDEEALSCAPFLSRQIALVDPAVIVTLGASATRLLLGPDARITKVRGQWHWLGERAVMPTFHPAFLLRDPRQKRLVWEDLQLVAARLGIAIGEGETARSW